MGFPRTGPVSKHLKGRFFGLSPNSMGPALPWFYLSFEDPPRPASCRLQCTLGLESAVQERPHDLA